MTLRRILVATLSITLGLGVAQPVYASVLTISGTVTTPNGVPVEGVSVSDGTPPSATTNVNGFYSLQETSFGTYTLRVTKGGLTSATADVTLSPTKPSATRDFTLLYLSSLDLPDRYLSTAGHTDTLQATLRTYAPRPGVESCAKITDTRTGATTAMTHTGTESGQQVWQYSPTLASGSDEGTFTLSARVDDCTTGTRIDTGAQPTTYTIDNTPPELDPLSLTPLDQGNTMFLSQPLLVKASDDRTGISPTGVSFVLENVNTSTTTPVAGEYDANTEWARTTAVALTPAQTYRVVATAQDRAGNVASVQHRAASAGGGFQVNSIAIGATQAKIPRVPCTVESQSGNTIATCENVSMEFAPTPVTIEGTRHAGIGYAEQTARLETATISATVNGVDVSLPAFSGAENAWRPRTVSQQFVVLQTGQASQRVTAAGLRASIGTLQVELPNSWTEAALEMAPVATVASSSACSDPSSGLPACTPDPIRFYLGDRQAAAVIGSRQGDSNPIWGRFGLVDTMLYVPADLRVCASPSVCFGGVGLPGHWQPLGPQGSCLDYACAPCPDGHINCWLRILDGYPAVMPSQYAWACMRGLMECVTRDDPSLPTPQPLFLVPATPTDDHEAQKHEVFRWASHDVVGEGVEPNMNYGGRDRNWHDFVGGAQIITQTNNRDYGTLQRVTKCTHVQDNYNPPFLCYGFSDGKSYDGVSVAWPGQWFVADETPILPRRYWRARAGLFHDGLFNDCLGNNPTRNGTYGETAWIMWDKDNFKIEGAYPPHWSSGTGGRTLREADNQSGGMKAWQESQSPVPTNRGNCYWTTWEYSIAARINELDDGATNEHGTVTVNFNHSWTVRSWSWSFGCGLPWTCSVNASPTNDTEGWEIGITSPEFDY